MKAVEPMRHADICALVEQGYERHTGSYREVEYHLVQMAAVQVLVFRGTEASKFFSGSGWRDVIRDIRILPWYDKRTGWSHSGFLKGARGVVDQIQLRDKPVIVTGHSLGAAISLLAGLILHADGHHVLEWVGFGCPRTGWGRGLPFPGHHYRHRGDIVTQIPGIYRHRIEPVQLGEGRGSNWTDHDIGAYLQYLVDEDLAA